jgi:hypothetical protein
MKYIKTKALVLSIIIGIIIFISLQYVNAETQIQTLGTFKSGETVTLVQNCLTSSYSNISRIIYPNGTFALDTQTVMVKNGDDYSYNFSNTDSMGQYIVYGLCDESGTKTNWVYDFQITSSGKETTISDSVFYIGVLIILIVFLILALLKITSNENYAWVIGYASLSYFLLLSILFIAYQISLNFLTLIPYISTILYIIFFITLILMLPLFIIGVIYLLSKIASEKGINELVEIGYSKEEAHKMKKRK